MLPKLWCAGKLAIVENGQLEQYPQCVKTFHIISGFNCRIRRKYYGKYTTPQVFIEYTSSSFCYRKPAVYQGKKCYVYIYPHLNIDPRGHFTMFRVAFIKVLDTLMLKLKRTKPLIEFAEFLANYPTW